MTDDIGEILDEIVRLLDAGQLADAEDTCGNALAVRPKNINLLGLMGAIAIAQDDPEKSIPHFRQVLTLDNQNAAAIRGLATAFDRTGREDEADALRDQLMAALPVEDLLAEAEALCHSGDFAEAEKICDAVLQRDPENRGALRVLAIAANENEQYVIAEAFFSRVIRLAPEDVGGIVDLARFLGDRGRYEEAITHLERAAAVETDNPAVQLMLGGMLAVLNRVDESLAAYGRCLEHSPEEPAALIGQAHMLRIAGRADDALASYRHCVTVSPEFGTAWWNLASMPGFDATDDDIETMQRVLSDGDTDSESRIGLYFALARAFEKRAEFDRAWAHFTGGNEAKRAVVKYDPVKSELDQRKIRDTYTKELLSRSPAKSQSDLAPVFILGVPRSGSTLVEQILASHSQVEGAGELPYILTMVNGLKSRKPGSLHYTEIVAELTEGDLMELGDNYLQAAASHRSDGLPFVTDKMPANYPHVGFIREILPQSRIIDARRDPIATCVANYRQLFAQGKHQSYDLTELGEYYVEYVQMMTHWDDVLPGTVLRVQYENLVSDTESEVRRLLDHCGLPFEEGCLAFHKSKRAVNTASAEQVRQPIYQSAVEFWRHYEAHLGELLQVLEPVLDT